MSPERLAMSGGKFGDIRIVNHFDELEYFKKKASTQKSDTDMVNVTKLSFIKYCVKLYKDKVEPMLKKLNRNYLGDALSKQKNVVLPPGRNRRANIIMNKEIL
jgi:hypothetical protein